MRTATALVSRAAADPLLDRFFPNCEVRERHETVVEAPADAVYAYAKQMRLRGLPIVRAIFALRELPSRLLERGLARAVDRTIDPRRAPRRGVGQQPSLRSGGRPGGAGREVTGVFDIGEEDLPIAFLADRCRDLGGGRSVL